MDESPFEDPADAAERIDAVVDRVLSGAVVDRSICYTVVAALLARGHVLIEDVPGTGKTVTARLLAEALGLEFTRLQFTPDLLPADVTGSTVYDEHAGEFRFAEGPIFTNVVLADEINRAPPKTQAALLEAMEEGQVSVDGTTHELPEPFFVIATQNPVEQEGTFRLPEAQRDRFSVKTALGYPSVEGELSLLDKRANRRTLAPTVEPAVDRETVLALQELAESVTVETHLRRYIVDLARATRADPRTEIGVSPRGVQRVFEAVRASAVIDGRRYAVPDDVKRLALGTMAHRLVLTTDATIENVDARDVIADALERVEVPAVSPGRDRPAGTTGGADADAPDPDRRPAESRPDPRTGETAASAAESEPGANDPPNPGDDEPSGPPESTDGDGPHPATDSEEPSRDGRSSTGTRRRSPTEDEGRARRDSE